MSKMKDKLDLKPWRQFDIQTLMSQKLWKKTDKPLEKKY